MKSIETKSGHRLARLLATVLIATSGVPSLRSPARADGTFIMIAQLSRPDGMACFNASECASGACINYLCGRKRDGEACVSATECASGACYVNTCGRPRKPDGSNCSIASECASGACINFVCGKKPDGAACFDAVECRSATCVDSVCGGRRRPAILVPPPDAATKDAVGDKATCEAAIDAADHASYYWMGTKEAADARTALSGYQKAAAACRGRPLECVAMAGASSFFDHLGDKASAETWRVNAHRCENK